MMTEKELSQKRVEMKAMSKTLYAVARKTGNWRDRETAKEYNRYMKALLAHLDREMAIQSCIGTNGAKILSDGAL